MTLTFTPSGHRYKLDGKPVTGVTTLINGGVPKPALVYWAAKVVAEYVQENPLDVEALRNDSEKDLVRELAKLPNQKRDDAGVRGTAVHALADKLVHGGEVEAPEDIVPYVEGYAAFLDEWQITPVLTERPCANRTNWWAGTFDLFATSPFLADGQVIEIDLKTSNGVYGETGLQTAAYAKAEFYLDADGKEQPLPHVAATYVAHVTPAGTVLYQLAKDRDQIDQQYQMFLAAAYTHKTAKLRDAIITEPLTIPTNTELKASA
jgi:hypothetical protein